MVWLIYGILLWCVFMLLVRPLIKKDGTSPEHSHEIAAYKSEIKRLENELIETNNTELQTQKIQLQRQLLELTKNKGGKSISKLLIVNALAALFIFGGIGLYAMLGSPELTKKEALTFAKADDQPTSRSQAIEENNERVEDMLANLKSHLEGEQKDNAEAWVVYARTLMNVGRFEDGFAAYEELIRVTDNHPRAVKEYELAKEYVANLDTQNAAPGPTQADMEAAAGLSPEERNAMITSMVESLSAKLKDNPKDTEGWVRLIRARKVLGQDDIAKREISLMRDAFADDPGKVEDILSRAGWED